MLERQLCDVLILLFKAYSESKAQQKKARVLLERELKESRCWLENSVQECFEHPAMVCGATDGLQQIETLRVWSIWFFSARYSLASDC